MLAIRDPAMTGVGARATGALLRRGALLVMTGVLVTPAVAIPVGASVHIARAAPTRRATKKPKLKLTPYEKAVGKVSDDGFYSKKAALRLFALTFGSVPGARSPKKPAGVSSGTSAIEAVMAHFDEYTPKQQRAIKRLLAPPPGAVTVVVPPVGQPLPPVSETPVTTDTSTKLASFGSVVPTRIPKSIADNAQSTAETIRALYADSSRLGTDIPGNILVTVGKRRRDPTLLGEATPFIRNADHGYDHCEIQLTAASLDTSLPDFTTSLAHEVFHCFQFYATDATPRAKWLKEGSTEWAALKLLESINEPAYTSWWPVYLQEPTTPLFERTYDALGFYFQVAQAYTDDKVWKMILPMLAPSSNDEEFAAANLDDVFLDAWAPGYFRGDVAGQDWNISGTAITNDKPPRVKIKIAADGPDARHDKSVDAYANQVYEINSSADLLDVNGTGHIRIADDKVDTIVHGSERFCTNPDGCVCPEEGGSPAPRFLQLPRHSFLALSGATTGAQVTIRGSSMKDLCCGGAAIDPVKTHGFLITPKVNCQLIGLKMEFDASLKLEISFALLVDHPRLRPHIETKDGKSVVTGVDLEGIDGLLLDFGAGAADPDVDNAKFEFDVPIDVEVPVEPQAPGLPKSMRVTWTIAIDTALTGDNATLFARGEYSLIGPLRIRDGEVDGPSPNVRQSLIDSISGISLGPSGIDILVETKFTSGAGTPDDAAGSFGNFTASFGVTNGASTGASLVRCHGATLALTFAGGARGSHDRGKFFDRSQTVPDVPLCQT